MLSHQAVNDNYISIVLANICHTPHHSLINLQELEKLAAQSGPEKTVDHAEFTRVYRLALDQLKNELIELSRFLFVSLTQLTHTGFDPEHEDPERRRPFSHSRLANAIEALNALIVNEIVSTAATRRRTLIMERWIEIMQQCFEAGDFHTVKVIHSALNALPVQRLMKTQPSLLSNDANAILEIIDYLVLRNDYYLMAMRRRSTPILPAFDIYKSLLANKHESNTLLDSTSSTCTLFTNKPNSLEQELAELQQAQLAFKTQFNVDTCSTLQRQILTGKPLDQSQALKKVASYESTSATGTLKSARLPNHTIISHLQPQIQAEIKIKLETSMQHSAKKTDAMTQTYLHKFGLKLVSLTHKIEEKTKKLDNYLIELNKNDSQTKSKRAAVLDMLQLIDNFDRAIKQQHHSILFETMQTILSQAQNIEKMQDEHTRKAGHHLLTDGISKLKTLLIKPMHTALSQQVDKFLDAQTDESEIKLLELISASLPKSDVMNKPREELKNADILKLYDQLIEFLEQTGKKFSGLLMKSTIESICKDFLEIYQDTDVIKIYQHIQALKDNHAALVKRAIASPVIQAASVPKSVIITPPEPKVEQKAMDAIAILTLHAPEPSSPKTNVAPTAARKDDPHQPKSPRRANSLRDLKKELLENPPVSSDETVRDLRNAFARKSLVNNEQNRQPSASVSALKLAIGTSNSPRRPNSIHSSPSTSTIRKQPSSNSPRVQPLTSARNPSPLRSPTRSHILQPVTPTSVKTESPRVATDSSSIRGRSGSNTGSGLFSLYLPRQTSTNSLGGSRVAEHAREGSSLRPTRRHLDPLS